MLNAALLFPVAGKPQPATPFIILHSPDAEYARGFPVLTGIPHGAW